MKNKASLANFYQFSLIYNYIFKTESEIEIFKQVSEFGNHSTQKVSNHEFEFCFLGEIWVFNLPL